MSRAVPDSSYSEVRDRVAGAVSAFSTFDEMGRKCRASLLHAIARNLDEAEDAVVETAERETHLDPVRLRAELARTTYQARFFADVLKEGSYLEVMIDAAGESPMGSLPDLRRMLVPIGPVAVFAASNFPLAFSVAGGDTISALAAGCPVIVKAHEGHPGLSALTTDLLVSACQESNAPDGVFSTVYGRDAGKVLVAAPGIVAAAFTGSIEGARALMGIAAQRDDPIPFYGELSSLNPVVITRGALQARSSEIADGLAASVAGSAGQLCTKPGFIFVPKGFEGDHLVARVGELLSNGPPMEMISERVTLNFRAAFQRLAGSQAVSVVAGPLGMDVPDVPVQPSLLEMDAVDVSPEHLDEVFGPAAVFVRYDPASLDTALRRFPGSLTATIHSEPNDTDEVRHLIKLMRSRAGRLVFNQFPTGVAVSWAQHHGGPWPSTNSLHTSVGASAIRRFLRPLVWQNAPATILPTELLDEDTNVPRRLNGSWTGR